MDRIELLTQFVATNPKDPFPRYGLAIELKNRGRLADAERAFDELMGAFPDYTAAYLHAGNVSKELGKKDRAAAVYRAGLEACERKRDAHAHGELEAALAALESGEG